MSVWNRTFGRAAALEERGARVIGSADDVGNERDAIFLCLADDQSTLDVAAPKGKARASWAQTLVVNSSVSNHYPQRLPRRLSDRSPRRCHVKDQDMVGQAIAAWEAVRPTQPAVADHKTSERVHLLFSYRAQGIGRQYLNIRIIPALCTKAGVPTADVRGNIASHRARSTIASQLYNAKEPMTLFELQAWLGHRSPSATQHYAKIAPTTLADSSGGRRCSSAARKARSFGVNCTFCLPSWRSSTAI
nr:tyrosine-type recombinase/integrase [Nocardia miyunensis]